MHYQKTRHVHERMSNRMRNAALSVLCSAALAVSMCPAVALAQGLSDSADSVGSSISLMSYDESSAYSVQLSTTAGTIQAGEKFDVAVSANTDDPTYAPLSSLEIRIAYDSSKVFLEGVTDTAYLGVGSYDEGDAVVLNFYGNKNPAVDVAVLHFASKAEAAGNPGVHIADVIGSKSGSMNEAGARFSTENVDVTILAPEKPVVPTPEEQNQTAVQQGYVGIESVVENAILTSTSEEGPAGSAFVPMKAKASKVTKSSFKLTWSSANSTKLGEAAKYVIFGSKCGTKMKKVKTTTSRSYKVTKLKKGKYYKYQIMALDAKGRVISLSKIVHVATTGGKVGNYKSVSVSGKNIKKGKVTLKKGKTVALKVKKTLASTKLKVKTHRGIKFVSSKKTVATVSSKGKIKAKGKGTCYVYAYAQNGVYAKVKVTVK